MLVGFVEKLESSIMEIRGSYDSLIDRFEDIIVASLKTKNKDFERLSSFVKEKFKIN